MLTNDILRRVRYVLDLSDPATLKLFATGGRAIDKTVLADYLKREDEAGMQLCPDDALAAFLNALIIDRRGARGDVPEPETRIDNNLVLKKLRIAFKLEDSDMQALLEGSSTPLTKTELSALFRKPGHKNYRVCGDQLLRQFLSGLTERYRPA